MLPFVAGLLLFSINFRMSASNPMRHVLAIGGQGCRAFTLVTALTAQNSRGFLGLTPSRPADLLRQAECLLSDVTIHACKIGLIPDEAVAGALATLLKGRLAGGPVVLDPVLASGGGRVIADEATRVAILELLPHVTVVTPNSLEARLLTGEADLALAAEHLRQRGCPHVLITGTHEDTPQVLNTLYGGGARTYACERLPHVYHGSGCTLASALAAHLARGTDMPEAVGRALDYTWNTLKNAQAAGRGQWHPSRFAGWAP